MTDNLFLFFISWFILWILHSIASAVTQHCNEQKVKECYDHINDIKKTMILRKADITEIQGVISALCDHLGVDFELNKVLVKKKGDDDEC